MAWGILEVNHDGKIGLSWWWVQVVQGKQNTPKRFCNDSACSDSQSKESPLIIQSHKLYKANIHCAHKSTENTSIETRAFMKTPWWGLTDTLIFEYNNKSLTLMKEAFHRVLFHFCSRWQLIPPTGQDVENKRRQNAQPEMGHLYYTPFSQGSGISWEKETKECENQKRWMTAGNMSSLTAGQMHVWTLSDCESKHELCASTSQTTSRHGAGELGVKPHPCLRSYWQLRATGGGRVSFL